MFSFMIFVHVSCCLPPKLRK